MLQTLWITLFSCLLDPSGSFQQSSARGECQTWRSVCQLVSDSLRVVILSCHITTLLLGVPHIYCVTSLLCYICTSVCYRNGIGEGLYTGCSFIFCMYKCNSMLVIAFVCACFDLLFLPFLCDKLLRLWMVPYAWYQELRLLMFWLIGPIC